MGKLPIISCNWSFVFFLIFGFGQPGVWAQVTEQQAEDYADQLHAARRANIQATRADEMADRVLSLGSLEMRFLSKKYGQKPADGWSLFISMHGGGQASASFNDSQWHNQLALGDSYNPQNAIYVAPRAPTNTWNLWHQGHIDAFFDRLIENFVVFEEVNPNKVYLMGYSAGGDGVYQLAPRMADRFAAAAMMAGHPNEAQPYGLRNLPFAIHVGEYDTAYNRSEVARQWGDRLAALRSEDADSYVNQVQIHAGLGHWMQLKDKVAVPWMQQYVRRALPNRVVWYQDDRIHDRFYWLGLPDGSAKPGQKVTCQIDGQVIRIEESEGIDYLLIRLNDRMLDLDEPVQVIGPTGAILYDGIVVRSLDVVEETFNERGDRALTFSASLNVKVMASDLKIENQGGQVELTWTGDWTLQRSETLDDDWESVSQGISKTGNENAWLEPSTKPVMFFRLVYP